MGLARKFVVLKNQAWGKLKQDFPKVINTLLSFYRELQTIKLPTLYVLFAYSNKHDHYF